jgi:hypothetical protein
MKREDVATIVRDWGAGRMSSVEVLDWAVAHYLSDDIDYEDWEGDNSVTNEVLGALDMLDMNLAIPEDAAIYLDFLSTPIGQFEVGYADFQRRLDEIDYDRRRGQLRQVFPYAPFLQTQSG